MQSLISPIIVALDKPNLHDALMLADNLDPSLCRLKVGKELFVACGIQIIHELHKRSFDVFLDLKFHDIPNTTAQAVLRAADLGVWMTNVHASVGVDTMQLAKNTLLQHNHATLLIAVTVLTSMTDEYLKQLGIDKTTTEHVLHLAQLTKQAGLDGVVCSAQEANLLKISFGDALKLVTPGIRLSSNNDDDQKRICAPRQAIQNGSDYLVIGRPISQADKPNEALRAILADLS